DAHTFDLTEFAAEEGRQRSISAFTMLDPKGQQLPYTTRDFLTKPDVKEEKKPLPLKIALIYDAVDLLAKAFDHINSQQKLFKPFMRCNLNETWSFGESIIKRMNMSRNKGFTGLYEFDEWGQRTNITLDVIHFRNTSYEKDAIWNSTGYYAINETEFKKKSMGDIKNIKFKVSTLIKEPYVMQTVDADGNIKYEGFCIDLLDRMKKDEENIDTNQKRQTT
ncbi:ionotropic glutamate receptor 9-like protein, partial [Dinothrombium tinctorium]